MGREFYTNIGIFAVSCVKYIFIPIGVAVITKIITDKLLQPQPGRQRKKRSNKNRLK